MSSKIQRNAKDIMHSLPIGIIAYKVNDPDKKGEMINPAMGKIVGYDASEMLAKT